MEKARLLERIAIDANVMVGKPLIKNTRLTVEYILGLLAEGATEEEILSEYHNLKHEDIQACLLFAKKVVSDSSFLPLS